MKDLPDRRFDGVTKEVISGGEILFYYNISPVGRGNIIVEAALCVVVLPSESETTGI